MIELNRNYHLVPDTAEAVKIKIIGIGGAGSNALDRIVLDGVESAELVSMNSDLQSLTSSVANKKVQLGRETTRGLGAGGDPEIGLTAAEESGEEIRAALDGAGMIFICVGLGGGTGSGAAPLVANFAREQGALVVVFATMPFGFEGKRRAAQAQEALLALQSAADAVICFENDTMGDAVSPKAGIHQAFAAADETISQSVRAISQFFARPGILHIGFDDLRTALTHHDARCLFGFGEAEGDNRSHEALGRALKNPLMDRGRLLSEARNVLVNVVGGPAMTLHEVQILMTELGRHIDEETQILFGTAIDPKMGDRLSVTILSSIGADVPQVAAIPVRVKARIELPADPLTNGNGKAHRSKEKVVAEVPVPVADAIERAEPEEVPPPAVTRPKMVPLKPTKPVPIAAAAAPSAPAKAEPKQETLQFEAVTRGRFEKSEPTIVDGQDLDVPTFLRRNVKVK